MTSNVTNIYGDSSYKSVDIGQIMRIGHPDIKEGDEHIINCVLELRKKNNRPLRILEIGSGSAHLCKLLAEQLTDCEIIANEIAEVPAQQAREKLAQFPLASVFEQPFEQWDKPVDVVISWGSHHHFNHDYLLHIQQLIPDDGLFLVGDELCPEYLSESDMTRFDEAEILIIEGGYIFDNHHDLQKYKETGLVPEWNMELEEKRRRALWKWYKFVGDFAIIHDSWNVLISELRIARDDLITEFSEEHKTSAYLLQRELKMNGFSIEREAIISDREPELLSTIIYSCRYKKGSPASGE